MIRKLQLPDLLSVSRGDTPADLVLKNARIVNVFSGEIEPGNIAIFAGHIAGIGNYHGKRGDRSEWRIRCPRIDRRACAHRIQPLHATQLRISPGTARRDDGHH